jgi:hypothetical protein
MKKTAIVVMMVICLFAIVPLGLVNATPKVLKQVNMLYSTSENPDKWLPVPGNQVSDFKLTLDASVEWYYLDIKFIKPTFLEEGYYMFWLTPPTDPEFWAYWDAKGVNAAAIPSPDPSIHWKFIMWRIITGVVPMFSLYSDGAGNYKLCDGLQRFAFGMSQATLRVNGDYPKGTYTFTCNAAVGPAPSYVPIVPNPLDNLVMNIEFR